jgi:hypothetical protein
VPATRVQLLPEVVDLSYVPMFAGLVSLFVMMAGVVGGLRPERVVRLALFGNLPGGIGAVAVIGLLAAVR